MEKFIGFVSILFICCLMSVHMNELFRMSQLCKFCDTEPTNCTGNGVCESECTISSICESPDDVCVGSWRSNKGNSSIETVCHNPALLFHGHNLTDSQSSICLMKRVEDDLYICSCNTQECNDRLVFNFIWMIDNNYLKTCKFCDVESTLCNATGVCNSSCKIISICGSPDEVCASAWRSNKGNSSIETVCHNPALLFHGHNLTDSQSSICLMKRVEDDLYICSCNTQECNDRLVFDHDSQNPPEPSDPPANHFCLKTTQD